MKHSRRNIAKEQNEILSCVDGIMSSMLSQSPPARFKIPELVTRPHLRGSDLPVCPIKLALDTVRKTPRTQYTTMMKDFYTKLGSEYHLLVQRWMGVSGTMYGKFSCPKCKKLHPEGCTETDNAGMLGPVLCKCSGFPIACDYVEFNPLGVKNTGSYNGHVDGVLKLNGKYIVLEIKTTDAAKVIKRRTIGPDPKHELQAQSYRFVLPRFLAIPEDQWHDHVLVWYFDRADPRINTPLCLPYEPDAFGDEITKFVTTMKHIKHKRYKRISGICKDANQERFCHYNQLCFSPQRDALINEILNGYL